MRLEWKPWTNDKGEAWDLHIDDSKDCIGFVCRVLGTNRYHAAHFRDDPVNWIHWNNCKSMKEAAELLLDSVKEYNE